MIRVVNFNNITHRTKSLLIQNWNIFLGYGVKNRKEDHKKNKRHQKINNLNNKEKQ